MHINLTILCDGLNDENLQNLSRDICQSINLEVGFEASLQNSESRDGMKGDSISIGEISLAILGSGGALVTLIGVFKSFIERSRELSFKIKKPDGEELEITSKNIDSAEIKSMIDEFLFKSSPK
jgi:hypothetical protein